MTDFNQTWRHHNRPPEEIPSGHIISILSDPRLRETIRAFLVWHDFDLQVLQDDARRRWAAMKAVGGSS